MTIAENINSIQSNLPTSATLVAISKTKPESMILEALETGLLDFGENKVQDLITKYENLTKEIRWHFIGHLQTNKVKYIAPFIYLIHGVDSLKLLKTINNEAEKNKRTIRCLLQLKIAKEDTKFGLSKTEAFELLNSNIFAGLKNISINGLMGMASFCNDEQQIEYEFSTLKSIFDDFKSSFFSSNPEFNILSMGMSDDYKIALKCGSNMVRIGSTIFGERHY